MKTFDNNELMSLMRRCYYSVTNDFGNGEEAYEGCEMNLFMILSDPDTVVAELESEEDAGRTTPNQRLFKVNNSFTCADIYIRIQEED